MTFGTLVCTYINAKKEYRMEMLVLTPAVAQSDHETEVFCPS